MSKRRGYIRVSVRRGSAMGERGFYARAYRGKRLINTGFAKRRKTAYNQAMMQ